MFLIPIYCLLVLLALDTKYVAIHITDNGMDITPEDLKKIFSHGFSTKESGDGYGLHSCAILAKQLDGSLNVESKGKDKGPKFILILPYGIGK